MKKVSKKDLIILAVILAAFSIFLVPRILFHGGEMKWSGSKSAAGYYCPMHPTYTSDRPGNCPICNMKLVPVTQPSPPEGERVGVRGTSKILYYRHPMGQPDTSPVPKKDSMGMDYIPVYEDEISGQASEVSGHAAIHIPLERQQLMGVKLGTVEKRPLKKEIRTSGRVAFDAELYTAQREFVSAVAGLAKSKHGPYHEPRERAEGLVDSVRTRLRLLGMSEEEMDELEKEGVQDKSLIGTGSSGSGLDTSSGLQSKPVPGKSGTWVYGNIYEYELSFVKVGSAVKIRVPTFPGREFTGEVRGLTPVLEPETRSIRVRAKIRDPEGLLRPEMYVDFFIESEMSEGLAVPVEAVMETGERKIIFVAKGNGHFEPREVTVGTKAGDFYEVKSGLAAGDEVVVSGNFLIDSESRLQAAFKGMGGGSGHQHGA